jgi:SAM-dependent methyltransferase
MRERPDSEAQAFARLYDVDMVEDPGDLDLYLALAARTGGPVLELAVGTGRVAVPLAAAGHEVTGIDRDRAMLDRARRRAQVAGAEARLDLRVADINGLRLERTDFRMAFIALNTLLLLASRDAQRAAVGALAAHLAPGGVAAVDVWLPTGPDLARFDGRIGLEYHRPDPDSGRLVVKTASAVHDPATGTVELTTIYEEGDPGSPADRWLRTDRLRLVSADELGSFAEDAGLEVEVVAGGFDLEPIGPGSERAIVVATKP